MKVKRLKVLKPLPGTYYVPGDIISPEMFKEEELKYLLRNRYVEEVSVEVKDVSVKAKTKKKRGK